MSIYRFIISNKSLSEITKIYCKLKDLDKEHIINIWGKDNFNYPECLTIYK